MLPHPASVPQPAVSAPQRIGVGIDTSRYGHYAAFLRDDLQPAAAELQFIESAAGYALFRQQLDQIGQRHGTLVEPARTVVAAAGAESLPQPPPPHQHAFLDFAHLKRQLPIARVLDQLGLTPRLRGKGPQQRCTCPIHRDDARGRTFSVHLDNNVFQCFDKKCGQKATSSTCGPVSGACHSVTPPSTSSAPSASNPRRHTEPRRGTVRNG